MILPIIGISTTIPSSYEEIIRRLKQLGLSPTGNPQLDRSRLEQAIESRVEKFELKKQEEEKQEERTVEKQLGEEYLGAQALAEQNKFFFGI